MSVADSVIEKPFLWSLFFWFTGMTSLVCWQAVLSLNAYWIPKFGDGVDAYYPFFYFAGSVFSFFLYDAINKVMTFKMQMTIIPIILSVSFYSLFIIGETMENGTDLKKYIFMGICVEMGFTGNILQTTASKFCFNFRVKDITDYTSGTALIGFLCALVGLI